jgi:hypothetical protein
MIWNRYMEYDRVAIGIHRERERNQFRYFVG